MKIPQLQKDKANHFFYGFLTFFLSSIFVNQYYCFAIVFFVGLGKEIYDKKKYGNFDIRDIFFTVLPAILLIIKNLIFNK